MSAFIVDKTHIDLLLAAGLHGPRGIAVSPDSAWRGLRWFAVPYGDVRHTELSYDEAYRELTVENADEVGQLLVMENVASVAYRYSEPGRASYYGPEVAANMEELALLELPGPGPADAYYLEPYRYSDPGYRLNAGEILQALACYEYQSCEHDDWPRSETAQFCYALQQAVCVRLTEGPWNWDADELAKVM
jgi:hypothetical protein